MPIMNPREPLTGLVQQSIVLISEYPHNPMRLPDEYYRPKFWVKSELEFDDEEAAKRFEEKMRRLIEADDMIVVDGRDECPTHPGTYGDH